MKRCVNCNSEVSDDARFCPVCGRSLNTYCSNCHSIVPSGARFCPKCGTSVDGEKNETPTETPRVEVEGEVIHNGYYQHDDEVKTRESELLRNQYSRRANNAFILSIVSVFLCCCNITAIISFILSILVILDMNKLSIATKNTEEYRRIKNKAVIALIIASFLVFMMILSIILQILNPTIMQQYEDILDLYA